MARKVKKRRVEQKAVLIALEDTKSSKYYFQALIKDKKLSGKIVFAKHIGTNPKKVLEALEKHKLEPKYKNIKYENEWIVIDRDNFPKKDFFGTIETSRQKNICVAFSNESYELWILLHFELVTKHTSRKELNSRLKKIFLEQFKIEYSKSSQDIYSFIINLQPQAIKNAKILVEQHKRDYRKINPDKNPITTVYQLVECLNYLYDKEKNCDCFPIND